MSKGRTEQAKTKEEFKEHRNAENKPEKKSKGEESEPGLKHSSVFCTNFLEIRR